VITTPPSLDLLYPLPWFFQAAQRPLPEVAPIDAAALPAAPFRLLAHAGDMTSKLEEFFADEMLLRVIQREHTAEHYRREVVLYGAKTKLPVEYGAIEIELRHFPESLRAEIVEARLPLGGLLNRHGLRYRSEPRGFLQISPCAWLTQLFELPEPTLTYGRSNTLLGADGEVLARILEILRPVA
jgi:hypothetical protein